MVAVPAKDRAAPLVDRIVGFIDHLRLNGFKVGSNEARIAVEHLGSRPLAPLPRIRQELKILFACGREDWLRFDDLFEAFWLASGRRRDLARPTASPDIRKPPKRAPLWQSHFGETADAKGQETPQIETESGDDSGGEASGRLIAAKTSVLQKTDLKHIVDPDEIRAAEDLAYRLASAMRYRLTRRYRPSRRGGPHRSAADHPPRPAARRRADRPLPPLGSAQAGQHRDFPRRVRLDEALQPLLPAVRQGSGLQLAAHRRLYLPHQAGASDRCRARPQFRPRHDPAGADGGRLRRRHAAGREPRHLQPSPREKGGSIRAP